MMNRLITKENYLDITKLLFNQMNLIDDSINRGFICESEILSEMFGIFKNEHGRLIYPPSNHEEIINFFKTKKFLIFNKIDIDDLYNFLKTDNIELDVIKLYDLDMYYFNSVKIATIVVRTWYLRLQYGLDHNRYIVKKYSFDELLEAVKSKIVVDQNENK